MAKLRPELNQGGKTHPRKGDKQAFIAGEAMPEKSYGEVFCYASPEFCNLVFMAFERCIECPGWRTVEFCKWLRNHIMEMPVELLTKIEGRIYPLLFLDPKGYSHINPDAFGELEDLNNRLRKYLYDL